MFLSRITPTFFAFFVLLFQLNAFAVDRPDASNYLQQIHSKLTLQHGVFSDEYPEQLMTARFLPEEAKVLELGGNIGRNTLVMASILKDPKNLVSLESDPDIVKLLESNRAMNHLDFHIENSALSNIPLIQNGWSTIPSQEVLPGYVRISTISLEDLQKKYNITFDTLVADCEGALYYILLKNQNVLKNINLVIMENDYTDIQHFEYVQRSLRRAGFHLVYNEAGGWAPCDPWFYQVWEKNH